MRKIVLLLIAFGLFTDTTAQSQSQKDSLRTVLLSAKSDTARIRAFMQLGRLFDSDKEANDSASWYQQQAIDAARKINDLPLETEASFHLANHLVNTGNYTRALVLSLQNLKKLEQIKREQNIAVKFRDRDLRFYQTRLLAFIYSNIGDYNKQFEYVKKMQDIYNTDLVREPNISENYTLTIYFNLANAYDKLKKPDSSFHYATLLYKRVNVNGDAQWRALAGNLLASQYIDRENKDSAMAISQRTISPARESGRFDIVTSCELRIGKLFQDFGKMDSAFFYSLKAMQARKQLTNPKDLAAAYQQVSELYDYTHRYDSAFKYLQQAKLLQDSLQDLTKIAEAQNFAFNETLTDQQLEQAKKEANLQLRNKIRMYSLAGVIAFILMATLLLMRNLRNKRKANRLLTEQKSEIERNLAALKATQSQLIHAEKMASLGELTAGIAHEIQNPLNFVNNFSEVSRELVDEMNAEIDKGDLEEAKAIAADIKSNLNKINHHGKRADAIVKGMLQHSRKSEGQKEPTDINALCDEYLRLSYHGLRAKDKSFNATLKTDFDITIGKINIIPQDIGRVIMNLLTNAFYAVNEKAQHATRNPQHGIAYEPTVSIRTKKTNENVQLTISDNGNGIPAAIIDKIFQPFFTTKPTGQGTGLGLSLAYDIVKAHGGELKAETEKGIGSTFIIKLPLV